MKPRILLIEDEAGLVMTLTDRLENEGYAVESSTDGVSGLERALDEAWDLILLDVMLPRKSGFDVCRELRAENTGVPILMLTARGETVDKVVGMKLGADDYLTKPFDMPELLVRIEALLRRTMPREQRSPDTFSFGNIRIDFRKAEVIRNGRPVTLAAREFQLLRYLVSHKGELLTRDQLLKDVWDYSSETSTRTVDVHMVWLRQKLEENPKHPEYFQTVRGQGYRFEV